jgi:hypothetical protein
MSWEQEMEKAFPTVMLKPRGCQKGGGDGGGIILNPTVEVLLIIYSDHIFPPSSGGDIDNKGKKGVLGGGMGMG